MGVSAHFIVELYSQRRTSALERNDQNVAALCSQIVENVRLSGANLIDIEVDELAGGTENLMRDAGTGKCLAEWCFLRCVTDSRAGA